MRVTGAIALVIAAAGCGPGPLEAVSIDPTDLTAGLVAHWSFDETGGSVVADRSGNRHDGQVTGGSWISSGQFGGALALAPGDHVQVANFPQASVGWTVSVWIQTSAEQLMMGSTDDWKTIISTENVFAGGWQLHLDSRPGFNSFDVAYSIGTTMHDYVVAHCNCIDVDRWIHLTAVFDGGVASELRFYRDDVVAERQHMPIPILPGDPTLYMGIWNQTGRVLAANLDDIAIWNRALDSAEIEIISRRAVPDPR